jgi:GNAT superfamily N-acetyltransferase
MEMRRSVDVDIVLFEPAEAPDAVFDDFHRIVVSAQAVDRPDAPPVTRESVVADLRIPMTAAGPTLIWTASSVGGLTGWVVVHLPSDTANRHFATVRTIVDPQLRRRGIGTALLRRVIPELRLRDRTLMSCRGVTEGGAGDRWARALGFRSVDRRVLQRLVIANADADLWNVPAPRGYHARHWSGAAPESLIQSFARARDAVLDAPSGDSGFRITPSSAATVRALEADLAERGFVYFVVAACCDDDGEVVGFTEILCHPSQPGEGMQQYTAVLAAHRGHGLGRYAKAKMMRWLVVERPGLKWIGTTTGAENSPMIAVNHQIGYITARTMLSVEANLDEVKTS